MGGQRAQAFSNTQVVSSSYYLLPFLGTMLNNFGSLSRTTMKVGMVTSEVLGEEERIERRRGKEKKKIASPSIESDEETIGGCGKGREST